MSRKEPTTAAEIKAAADRWLANLPGWKRRYVEGLRNEIATLRETLACANATIREAEDTLRRRAPASEPDLRPRVSSQDAWMTGETNRRRRR